MLSINKSSDGAKNANDFLFQKLVSILNKQNVGDSMNSLFFQPKSQIVFVLKVSILKMGLFHRESVNHKRFWNLKDFQGDIFFL